MNRLLPTFLLATALSFSAAWAADAGTALDKDGNPTGFRTLKIGDRAPDFSLP